MRPDLRVAGTYRYAFGRDPKKPEVFSGRYIDVNPPSRLVLTQVYERMADVGEAVMTATFEESQGRTRLPAPALPKQGSVGRRGRLRDGARNA